MSKPIVYVDAGHGGPDTGALGPGGLQESDTVLDVSLRAVPLLKAAGVDARLTRGTDEFVGRTARAQMANRAGARCFVSLHCNSYKKAARGIETWIARRTKVSYPLGEELQEALMDEFPEHVDRGVKRANFTVLTATRMAAALVELEFIHTPEGERHLALPRTRERCAIAVTHGILRWLGMPIKPPGPREDPPEPPVRNVLSLGEELIRRGREIEMLGHQVAQDEMTLN